MRLAELLALLHVGQRVVEAPWAMPTACAPIVTRVWSRVRSAIFEALADVADDPVAGDAHVVEVQLAGRAALDAELALLLAEGEARVGLLDDEGADVVAARAVRVGHGEDGVVLGDTGVRDPRLLAVEDPVVAVLRARHFIAAVSEPASRSDSP